MKRLHDDTILTADEVAKWLGRSRNTVRRFAARIGKKKPARFFSGAEVKKIMGISI